MRFCGPPPARADAGAVRSSGCCDVMRRLPARLVPWAGPGAADYARKEPSATVPEKGVGNVGKIGKRGLT
ncbi:hypothetical protein GCM10022262_28730 [Georgenia daeguensis]|uniref:Uncharacterized protein n=1 Tax=Georgenia daeguensis TaxID=908355 RepID=A0ABP8EWZ1_9MICO